MLRFLFLPVGLVLVLVLGLLWPEPGEALRSWTLGGVSSGSLLVVTIFLTSGYSLKLAQLWENLNRPGPILVAAVLNLLLAPWLALLVGLLFDVPEGILIGLVVTTAVPTTLSSAMIIAQQAGGNATLALVLTIVLNVLGVATTPLMVDWTLSFGADLQLSYWDLLIKLVLLVLVPLVVGYGLKKLLSWEAGGWLSYVASTCVILFVGMMISQNADSLHELALFDLGLLLGLALMIHLALLGLGLGAGRLLGQDGASRLTMGLIVGQKTLPVAFTVLFALEASGVPPELIAEAAVVAVLFHLLQIILDSVLAPILARQMIR